MPQTADHLADALSPQLLQLLLHEHQTRSLPRLERLWLYYRNPLTDEGDAAGRRYRLGQEQGLPRRLTGGHGADHLSGAGHRPQRERVIENDIGWRIHTLVDFMFGKPVTIQSRAAEPGRAQLIEQFLHHVIQRNGGVSFFQDLALLGAVYGFVDIMVHVDEARVRKLLARSMDAVDPAALAEAFTLETVEAPRAVPVLNSNDYRQLDAYVLHVRQQTNELEPSAFLTRVRHRVLGSGSSRTSAPAPGRRIMLEQTQVWTAAGYQCLRTRRTGHGTKPLTSEQCVNRLGRIPVVHIQNLPQPFFYAGLSEVEPLIPLQDELNTRLSDRANRVTFQSFKMYLGKGIEQFTERPIGPGQMWSTDNPDASIEAFGGDSHNPSEEAHINEIREALDKTSGVTPVAAGLIRGKVGNLTSENALRMVMMGLLAKTEKKRVTYGAGIERLCQLLLEAADVHNLLPNRPEERGVRLDWPNPAPDSETQRLMNAKRKLNLGVPRQRVLNELGYSDLAPDCPPEAESS